MAYTIKVHGNESDCRRVQKALRQTIAEDGRFRLQMEYRGAMRSGKREGSRKPGIAIVLKRVRLTENKPYCGQHAGPCLINPFVGEQPKKRMSFLEWDDWVKLHNLVNDVLDQVHLDADVWTDPREINGTMWIRKGTKRRIRYDYTEDNSSNWSRMTGLPVFVWNQGTPDQFEPEAREEVA